MAGGTREDKKRPFFRATAEELEKIYKQHPYNKKVLTQLDKELALRKVKSARRLHALVKERLDEIRQKDGRRPFFNPTIQNTSRRPTIEQSSFLVDMPLAAKAVSENQQLQKPEIRQKKSSKIKLSLSGAQFIIVVLFCLLCFIFVLLLTWDKTSLGTTGKIYEEQVRTLLN